MIDYVQVESKTKTGYMAGYGQVEVKVMIKGYNKSYVGKDQSKGRLLIYFGYKIRIGT